MAVARSQTESGGRLIWSEITSAMLEETGTTLQEAEGVIDQLQTVGPMKVAVLFKQAGPQLTKISVRSRDEIDATQVCTPFGGGGHRRAAGAELREPLETARKRVLDVARALLGPTS
jgi:phosphoesterase RecJ-like protein